MYHIHDGGIKSHLQTLKNEKKKKSQVLSTTSTCLKVSLKISKKCIFSIFGENFLSSVSSTCKIKIIKFKNFENFRPFLIPWSFS